VVNPVPNPGPEIANHIRRFRFEHGEMTQDHLAKQAGVTRHTIMALEAGKYFPSLLLAFRIARVFGVPVEQVFEYHGDGPQ
jgi:putative transcriptional regulator